MRKEVRQESLLQQIRAEGHATIQDLHDLHPDVSVMTVYRDLDDLEAAGSVKKVRGGAEAVQGNTEDKFAIRELENRAEKEIIARKASRLFTRDSSIFLDAGTTTTLVAQMMPDVETHIFTVAPGIALDIANLANPTVTMCPGTLHRDNLMLTGFFTLEMLEQLNLDIAIIGTSGFSLDRGFTCAVESQMSVKRAAIRRAKTVCVVMDHSKIDRDLPFTLAGLTDIDCIITDQPLAPELADAVASAGVAVI